MLKQHGIKLVIIIKTLDIKLALFHIIFKNDVADKKRFNFIDKSILKSQYFDISFDSNSISNSDTSCKINIETLNL